MGKMTPTYAEQYDHEADDLFDDLAKLENARLSGDFERMRIQRQRMITHLTRMEEIERLVQILEDD